MAPAGPVMVALGSVIAVILGASAVSAGWPVLAQAADAVVRTVTATGGEGTARSQDPRGDMAAPRGDTAMSPAVVPGTVLSPDRPGAGATGERMRRSTSRGVPESGPGTFTVVAGLVGTAASEPAGTTSYTIEIEDRLPVSTRFFARTVRATLRDDRGWQADGHVRLVQVARAADLRIVLATPTTTDRLCAPLQTKGRVSCRNGRYVVINAWRWVHGAASYRGDLRNYRRYVINHEVGHALGRPHRACPSPGVVAPVMLQQTLGLQGCTRNPWPSAADLRSR